MKKNIIKLLRKTNTMKLKLTFVEFTFKSNGTKCEGKVKAIIKCFITKKWRECDSKEFKTRITLKPNDKFDLNKAYKYIQAKLEKDAYKWANKEAEKQLLLTQRYFKMYDDFTKKSTHIIVHDENYLSTF